MAVGTARVKREQGVGVVGPVLLGLTVLAAVLVVQQFYPAPRYLSHLTAQVVPCAAIIWGLRRYRPAHPAMWWWMALYFAATSLSSLRSLVNSLSAGGSSFFDGSALRFALGIVDSVAAVAAPVAMLVVRRRRTATWAMADAAIISLGLFAALLVTNLMPLYSQLGPSWSFWTIGVLYGVRDLVMIGVAVVLLYSEQIRSTAVAVFAGIYVVWGVVELIWMQIGVTSTDDVLRSILLSLLLGCTVACTAVAIHPSMREVVEPSNSPRPSWTVGRTVALAVCLIAPLVAIWVEPPQTPTQLLITLIALAVLLVAVVVRMRASMLQVHGLLDQVEDLADRDHLTGLPNRRYLYGTFLDRWRAAPAPTTLVLNYLDLDNLREVNDRLDHSGGDRLLRSVADGLSRAAGPDRLVVRVGGDEFVILTSSPADDDPAVVAAAVQADILQVLERLSAQGHDSRGSVGTSWGTLELDPERELDQLLQEADLAQAEAKRAGGARGVIYERAMSDRSRTRAALRRSLPDAWANGQMSLVYQSVIDLDSGAMFGVESLLRWDHPVLGPVPPPDAIDAAVGLGLITELGLQILGRAQDDIGSLPGQLRVGVNVAAPQLRPSSIDALIESVHRGGLAGRVWLELTEETLVTEQRYVAGALADLRAAGLMVAIDDFGTGYCGLDYLCSLPIDLVKLDRVFAAHVDDPIRRRVSQTVTQLAEAIGAEVIAEGIESLETAERMHALGCRYGQGYALRRPTASIQEAVAPLPHLLRPVNGGRPGS